MLTLSYVRTYVRREKSNLLKRVARFVFACLVSVYYISYLSLQSFIPIKHSAKELTFNSYFLFFHNSSDSFSSAPFRRLPSTSASQSWYVRHVRYLALEVVKEKIPDSSAAVDYNPLTTIIHNLNLTLPTGSRCLIVGANGSGDSTLL